MIMGRMDRKDVNDKICTLNFLVKCSEQTVQT